MAGSINRVKNSLEGVRGRAESKRPIDDWRVGLSVKTVSHSDSLYHYQAMVMNVYPSGHGGLSDKDGVLKLKLSDGRVVLRRASEWQTA